MDYLSLEYSDATLVDDNEPSRCIKLIDGKVVASVGDDDDTEDAGSFSVIVVDAERAVSEREDTFDVMDSYSRTMPYYDLWDDSLSFTPEVIRAMGGNPLWRPNILILDRLELLPKYRGKKNGLRVIRWMCQHFGTGCGVIAMKPFPLQFENGHPSEKVGDEKFERLGFGALPHNFRDSLRRLKAHYRTLGFRSVAKTPFMVRDPERPFPKRSRGRG